MAIETGEQLINLLNQHGLKETGVCECGHWFEEHTDRVCEACNDNELGGETHPFIFEDGFTYESEWAWEQAEKLTGLTWQQLTEA